MGRRQEQGFGLVGQTAEQDLKVRLETIRTVEGNNQAAFDETAARNILHEDLGRFDGEVTTYGLDQATRDRLIAHTRQDAAHAVLSVGSLSKEVRGLRRSIKRVIALLFAVLAVEILRLFL